MQRQFAADRLAEQADAADIQDRHAAYWCDRAVTLGRASGGTDQAAVLDAIDTDVDNYRRAFAHLLTMGKITDAARGILALDTYWASRRTREALRWYQQLLTDPDLDTHRRIRALSGAARAELHVGDVYRGERDATEAVQLAEDAGVDAPWAAFEALMLAAKYRDDAPAYRRWWDRGYQVVVANGQRYLQLLAEAQRGTVPGSWDDDELIVLHDQLQRETRRHGDPMLIFMSARTFATVLHRAGQTERARDMAQSTIEPGRRAGPITHSSALEIAAALDALGGDTNDARARATAAEGLRVARDEGLTTQALYIVFIAAALAAQRDDSERAASLLAGGAHHGGSLGLGPQLRTYNCRVRAQTALDAYAGDLSAAQQRGEAMTLDDLINYALETLT